MRYWGPWDWIAYMQLGLAIFFLTINQSLSSFPKLNDETPAFLKIPIFSFLPAIFFIFSTVVFMAKELGWVGQQENTSVSSHDTDILQKPELHLSLTGANVFVPDAAPNLTGIALDASIWNTGIPSIVTGWSMNVIPNGKSPVPAQLTEIPNILTATGPKNSATILAKESLYDKTKDENVTTQPIYGKLLFYVQLPKAVVQAKDTAWELKVRDIFEKETRSRQLVGDWLQR